MKDKSKKIDSLKNQEIDADKVQGGTKNNWDKSSETVADREELSSAGSVKSPEEKSRPDVIYKSVIKGERNIFSK